MENRAQSRKQTNGQSSIQPNSIDLSFQPYDSIIHGTLLQPSDLPLFSINDAPFNATMIDPFLQLNRDIELSSPLEYSMPHLQPHATPLTLPPQASIVRHDSLLQLTSAIQDFFFTPSTASTTPLLSNSAPETRSRGSPEESASEREVSASPEAVGKAYKRVPIPRRAKGVLKKIFEGTPHPSPARIAEISAALGLERKKVRVWFQNQRAQLKRLD
ncbi:hypothetical protein BC830DRAFT_659017 [Chytriomyces sp. MP71]|nr:hypothetical protein BC830DRAFT_659017 [Chytriomyces sp. MP71]